jgi:hypothetical protein
VNDGSTFKHHRGEVVDDHLDTLGPVVPAALDVLLINEGVRTSRFVPAPDLTQRDRPDPVNHTASLGERGFGFPKNASTFAIAIFCQPSWKYLNRFLHTLTFFDTFCAK